ncbi:hypothetical protein C1646_749252 [Rhizophagus diaphanus]|nr:hypothetical protein C1646_749252 [Rhizophagus diaphanus] [Rhizophagus sp. MUCL 43196]
MACGENPKKVYRFQNRMPTTRLGEAWLFRKKFEEAKNLFRKQNDWCDFATHALDAYRIPDVIKRASSQITIATFSDLLGYKKVTFEAAKAHHYGLDEKLAIASNIGKVFIDEDTIIESNSSLNGKNISIIVKDGLVEFIGINCTNTTDIVTRNSPEVIGLNGEYILSGMIAGAIDGLKLNSKSLNVAYKAGVLTSITAPLSSAVISGISVAFKTGSQSVIDSNETIIEKEAALQLWLPGTKQKF